jgi:hemerythrin-like domain-containing protein
MVTQLPSTGSPGCDTSDMVMIHGFYRLVFGDAPAIVASAEPGDAARAQIVGDHLLTIAENLHHHHHGEDVMLWDQLEARNPACAAHVSQMRTHHAAMATELATLRAAVAIWQQEPSTKHRDIVRKTVEGINELLNEHLGSEEKKILPVAAKAFSQDEWNKLGEHGRGSVAKDFRLVQLGFILESMPEADRDPWLTKNLPLPVRLIYRFVGRPQYLKYRSAVYG